ncbi:MAG: SEC-C metal-binding domain-containing protein [Eubacterium sp.]|jgi:hypothetical protein
MEKSLYKQWDELLNGQTKATVKAFWNEYSDTEKKIYAYVLAHHDEHLKGKVSDLVAQFKCDKVIFVGFLDGIQTSLNNPFDVDKITLDSEIDLDVDFEKLYFNMHKAGADYLWSLEEWDGVLSEEKRLEIYNDYRRSRTVHVPKKPGRNDPCPCGSGKKYKNCHGRPGHENDPWPQQPEQAKQ